MITRRVAAGLASICTLAIVAACSSSSSGGKKQTSAAAPAPSIAPSSSAATSSDATPKLPSAQQLYVSIGDSYAAGYQPSSPKSGRTTTTGFAYQLVSKAKAKGYDYTLVNFGCAGATTSTALKEAGCKPNLLGPGAPPYSGTQATAAEQYLKAHQGKVGLITVILGGNDITPCAGAANATQCVAVTLDKVKANLTALLTRLRAAAGPAARIVGLTYPDVFLGDLFAKNPKAQGIAKLSAFAFKSLINPALQSAYEQAGGTFVDVTAATGGYGSLTATTTLPPFGTIPVAAAKICTLTFYCEFHDIHPRPNGYALIADLIVKALPRY